MDLMDEGKLVSVFIVAVETPIGADVVDAGNLVGY